MRGAYPFGGVGELLQKKRKQKRQKGRAFTSPKDFIDTEAKESIVCASLCLLLQFVLLVTRLTC